MARVLDLGESRLDRRLEHGSWVVGAQLKPGTQTRLLVIGCFVSEFDAEMSPPGKSGRSPVACKAGPTLHESSGPEVHR